MRCLFAAVVLISCDVLFAGHAGAAEPVADKDRQMRELRDYAMGHDGNATKGRELFNEEARAGCVKCHSVDGTAGKVGPDLFSVGDRFPRRELIRSVLEPSAAIAVGYGMTIVEMKSGEEFQGIIKGSTAETLELAGADGKRLRLATKEIKEQRSSTVSLMPEGLTANLSRQEFTDLIQYLVTLQQPENALTANRGMPSEIRELAKPARLTAFLKAPVRNPPDFIPSGGEVSNGLVWFGQVPGRRNSFVVVHQSGKIWLIEKTSGTNETRTLFLDLTAEVFHKSGPNGLLGMAFHPRFTENHKYYLKHQVFEGGKIVTTVVERMTTEDGRADSGKASRRLWQVASTTQDHSGGSVVFGPDGFLYIGMGDTGPQTDPQGHGQDLMLFLGKMLRIDVDHADAGLAYAIPQDNPFIGRTDARPEIWAYGFREPWRFSFDRLTGDLWVGDVGQDRVEEVSVVRRGENLGWNVYEGYEPFSNKYRKEAAIYTPPVFAYRRKFGNSITGGYVYRADRQSSFYGVYICGDYVSRRIFGLRQKDRALEVVRQIGTAPEGIASFGMDTAGEIYVVGYQGMVWQVDLKGANFE